jgi:hypothetical protein
MITSESASYVDLDRRKSPRIELLGEIAGQIVPYALPVVLLDLSPGGFAIASPVPFTPDSEYTFNFNATRQHGPIRAIAAHCLRVSHGSETTSYVAGFSFVLDKPASKQSVDSLIAEANDMMVLAGSVQLTTDGRTSYLNPAESLFHAVSH